MDYSILAETYERLEKTPAKLKKRDILAELLEKTKTEELPKLVLLIAGRVFPSYAKEELGIANQMMKRAISKATGVSVREVTEKFKELGDLGLVAEQCIKSRKQATLSRKKLTVDNVFENLRKLPSITGAGSQERKLNLIAELLTSAQPKEARYIVRTALQTLRIGVAEGIIRDAIGKAFNVDAKVVEAAWNLRSDYGEIAKIAKERGSKGLKKVRLQLGVPVQVLLAEKAPDLETALKKFDEVALEFKYDGMRAEIHKKTDKKGEKIWIFTRRLEDVSKQFPDLVKFAKAGLKVKNCIVEGEVIAINPKTGRPLPFQQLSQRVQRKYNIERMVKEIPIQINLFDITYLNGKTLFDKPFKERRKTLEKIIKPIKGKFQLAEQFVTKDLKKANAFYQKALDANQEGLIVKNLNAKYLPARRVGYWLKVKPVLESLDLAITEATWGVGKRAKWFSSFLLACRDPSTGELLSVGRLGTGFTDAQFSEMTKRLKDLIISEKGRNVKLKPKVIIEVTFEEIQRSPHYSSGLALRFPRLRRFREDKSEPDTITRVRKIFKSQGKAG